MIKYTSSVEVVAHRNGVEVGKSGLRISVVRDLPGDEDLVFRGDQNAAVALRDALSSAITRAHLIGEL